MKINEKILINGNFVDSKIYDKVIGEINYAKSPGISAVEDENTAFGDHIKKYFEDVGTEEYQRVTKNVPREVITHLAAFYDHSYNDVTFNGLPSGYWDSNDDTEDEEPEGDNLSDTSEYWDDKKKDFVGPFHFKNIRVGDWIADPFVYTSETPIVFPVHVDSLTSSINSRSNICFDIMGDFIFCYIFPFILFSGVFNEEDNNLSESEKLLIKEIKSPKTKLKINSFINFFNKINSLKLKIHMLSKKGGAAEEIGKEINNLFTTIINNKPIKTPKFIGQMFDYFISRSADIQSISSKAKDTYISGDHQDYLSSIAISMQKEEIYDTNYILNQILKDKYENIIENLNLLSRILEENKKKIINALSEIKEIVSSSSEEYIIEASNDPVHKLRSHSFTSKEMPGNCQKRSNSHGLAQGYYDLFVNSDLIVCMIKNKKTGKDEGRMMLRRFYNAETKQKIIMLDRIYLAGKISRYEREMATFLIAENLYNGLTNEGYLVALPTESAHETPLVDKFKSYKKGKTDFELLKLNSSQSRVYSKGRLPYAKVSYYNDSGTKTIFNPRTSLLHDSILKERINILRKKSSLEKEHEQEVSEIKF